MAINLSQPETAKAICLHALESHTLRLKAKSVIIEFERRRSVTAIFLPCAEAR